jgi:tRNA modification GTPase
VIVESVDLRGIALRLSDTAGIREPGCEIERMGVERSERAIEESDLAIFVVDSSEPLSSEDLRIIEGLTGKSHVVVAANKIDLNPDAELSGLATRFPGRKIVRTSATRGTGINDLEEAVFSEITNGATIAPEEVLVSRLRHRQALEKARENLRAACEALEKKLSLEFVAVDLREALDHLGEIIGTVVTDDLLDRIFSEFCIGK